MRKNILHQKFLTVVKLCAGAIFLVIVAVFISDPENFLTWMPNIARAAVTCYGGANCQTSIQTFSLAAIPDAVNGQVLQTFSSNGKTYLVVETYPGPAYLYQWLPAGTPSLAANPNGCFGSATVCASTSNTTTYVQSFPFSAGAYSYPAIEVFTVGTDTYLVAGSKKGGSGTIYKWIPASNCFGNAAGTCGTAQQSVSAGSGDAWIAVSPYTVGSTEYLAVAKYKSSPVIYKWIPSGATGAPCFGNGTTCGTVLETMSDSPPLLDSGSDEGVQGPYPFGVDTFVTPTDGATYLMIETRQPAKSPNAPYDKIRIYKWMPAQNCFGDGVNASSCGSTAVSTMSTYGSTVERTFSSGSNTYLYASGELNIGDTWRLFIWNPTLKCFGNGTYCWDGSTTNGLKSVQKFAIDSQGQLGASITTQGSNLIFALSAGISSNAVQMFLWTPPPTNSNLGCIGDGVSSCGTKWTSFSAIKAASQSVFFTVGNQQYAAVVWTPKASTYQISVFGNSSTIPAPTIGISVPAGQTSLTYGQGSATITGTFAAGGGDTIAGDVINGPAPYTYGAIPAGYSWTPAGGMSQTPTNTTSDTKTYTFTPTATGDFTFIPDIITTAYPSPWQDQGKYVTIHVSCPAGSSGSTCTVCTSGYGMSGGSCQACAANQHTNTSTNLCENNVQQCTPPNAPANSGTQTWNGTSYGSCIATSCNSGYTLQTGVCVQNAVSAPPTISVFTAGRARKGGSPTHTWTVTGMASGMTCTIIPAPLNGQPVWNGNATWNGSTLGAVISVPTNFTLTCGSAAAGYVSKTSTATLVPSFEEI